MQDIKLMRYAICVIAQYSLPNGSKPEPFLHGILSKLPDSQNPESQEIINASREIHLTDESHKYINEIIERLGLDRGVGLNKIIDLISESEDWAE